MRRITFFVDHHLAALLVFPLLTWADSREHGCPHWSQRCLSAYMLGLSSYKLPGTVSELRCFYTAWAPIYPVCAGRRVLQRGFP